MGISEFNIRKVENGFMIKYVHESFIMEKVYLTFEEVLEEFKKYYAE